MLILPLYKERGKRNELTKFNIKVSIISIFLLTIVLKVLGA